MAAAKAGAIKRCFWRFYTSFVQLRTHHHMHTHKPMHMHMHMHIHKTAHTPLRSIATGRLLPPHATASKGIRLLVVRSSTALLWRALQSCKYVNSIVIMTHFFGTIIIYAFFDSCTRMCAYTCLRMSKKGILQQELYRGTAALPYEYFPLFSPNQKVVICFRRICSIIG